MPYAPEMEKVYALRGYAIELALEMEAALAVLLTIINGTSFDVDECSRTIGRANATGAAKLIKQLRAAQGDAIDGEALEALLQRADGYREWRNLLTHGRLTWGSSQSMNGQLIEHEPLYLLHHHQKDEYRTYTLTVAYLSDQVSQFEAMIRDIEKAFAVEQRRYMA